VIKRMLRVTIEGVSGCPPSVKEGTQFSQDGKVVTVQDDVRKERED